MALLFQNKVSSSFTDKVSEISDRLGIDANWLMLVIEIESAGSFSPSKTNSIGCVGLIQFCPDSKGQKTIGKETVTIDYLKNLSAEDQLEYVYKYYKPYRPYLKSFQALFLATFTPGYLKYMSDDGFVFPTNFYKQNPKYFKYGNSMESYKKTLIDLAQQSVGGGFMSSFLKKKSYGETSKGVSMDSEVVTRSIFRIYRKEIIITISIIIMLVVLWYVGKKLIK